MSEYTHRMSLAVPQAYMPQANQLALITGISAADVNTFTDANWQDRDGNLYAVCSTAIKQLVLGMLGIKLSSIPLPSHTEDVDVVAAQEALDKAIMWSGIEQVSTDKILIAIDYEPLQFFKDCGLMEFDTAEEVTYG